MGRRKSFNPIGRPTKFTEKVKADIIKAVEKGNYLKTACQAAGVSYETLVTWRNKAAEELDGSGPFSQFLRDVAAAEGRCEKGIVQNVHEATKNDPELGLKLLARRHPDHWGDHGKSKLELTGPDGKPIQVDARVTWVDLIKKASEAQRTKKD